MRLADPRPSLCTACGNSGEQSTRYVDCESVREGPVVLDDTGQIAVDPHGALVTFDDVFLCDGCVRAAAALLEVKPELHSRQLREIKRLELQVELWKDYARRQEQTLASRPEIDVPKRRAA